jgi:hypothetical protein
MRVLYRISDNSYKDKNKLPNATKRRCLQNFMVQWPIDEVIIFMDKCIPETEQFLTEYAELCNLKLISINEGSSAQSFSFVVDYALKHFSDDEIVYFVEDDYFHIDYSRQVLLEGIERADYVTLYTHPDKFIPASHGGNPLIGDFGGEETVVIRTKNSYWMLTNSTTLTFATTVGTLREDYEIWKQFCFNTHEQTYPRDFDCFLKLREKGRSLIMPLPAFATHTEIAWLSYDVDWEGI